MEYITVLNTAEKWGVTVRQVQNLCEKGKVPGAIRFNKMWAIPKNAGKPRDGRYKAVAEKQDDMIRSFHFACTNEEMLAKVVEIFPYPIHVYSTDGTLVFVNESCLKTFHISSKELLIGKINILNDSDMDKWGVKEYVLRAFQGETMQLNDMKVPISDIFEKHNLEIHSERKIGYESLSQNILTFPIYDKEQLLYVVIVFITSRLYQGKEEIIKGKEHIENHWLKEFNIDEVAGSVSLSKYYFARLFKKHTGITPYTYYQDIKISKLKEKLCNRNISISKAFADCGVAYNGNYAKVFKEKVGMTPSQYRLLITKK